jgi:beta-lactamase superfamily II metal-dependent hydrolase
VLERYGQASVRVARTDLDGAVSVSLGDEIAVASERARRARYWLQ